MKATADCFEEMKKLRLKYPKKVIIGYININSIRNKFENFSQMLGDKFDIVTIAETKLNSSFPSSQFKLTGFKEQIRLDISNTASLRFRFPSMYL